MDWPDDPMPEPLDQEDISPEDLAEVYPGPWGYLLFPLRGGTKVPAAPAGFQKGLVEAWRNGSEEGLAAHLEALARHIANGGNLGMWLPPGVIAFDLEERDAIDAVISSDTGCPYQTSRLDQARGRGHALFRLDPGQGCPAWVYLNGAVTLVKRPDSGYLVVWPSEHPETQDVYSWETGLPDKPGWLPKAPDAWLKPAPGAGAGDIRFGAGASSERDSVGWDRLRRENDGRIPDGLRHEYLVHVAWRSRAVFGMAELAILDRLEQAQEHDLAGGGRVISQDELERIARWASEKIALPSHPAQEQPQTTPAPGEPQKTIVDPGAVQEASAPIMPGFARPLTHEAYLLDRPPEPIVAGMIYRRSLHTLNAPPKSGKTFLAAQLLMCVSQGQPFLGQDTVKSPVLFLSLEMPAGAMRVRMEGIAKGIEGLEEPVLGQGLEMLASTTEQVDLEIDFTDPQGSGRAHLEWLLSEYEPRLVVIDMLYRVVTGEQTPELIKDVYNWLARLARQYDCGIVILDGTAKIQHGTVSQSSIGTVVKGHACSVILMVEPDYSTGDKWRLKVSSHYGDLEGITYTKPPLPDGKLGVGCYLPSGEEEKVRLREAVCRAVYFHATDGKHFSSWTKFRIAMQKAGALPRGNKSRPEMDDSVQRIVDVCTELVEDDNGAWDWLGVPPTPMG